MLNREVHQDSCKTWSQPRAGGKEIGTCGLHNDEFTSIAAGLPSSLYNAAVRLTRDGDEAAALLQDTYTYAFAHAGELRSVAAAKAWLTRFIDAMVI
jgi:DNA-directed RNA polymerase specialized sigma24 family protein